MWNRIKAFFRPRRTVSAEQVKGPLQTIGLEIRQDGAVYVADMDKFKAVARQMIDSHYMASKPGRIIKKDG